MPALSMGAYALYAYALLPVIFVGFATLYSSRYQICPLIVCLRPLMKCVQEPECLNFLNKLQECQNPQSEARQRSAATFGHVQHPQDPSFCRYQCFDSISTHTALNFVECVGSSGCLEPSEYSDVCATLPSAAVLPFEIIKDDLEGSWMKLYTTGWDSWPCQWTEFHPPHSDTPPPAPWMTAWPDAPNVWRMDLQWANEPPPKTNITFHMCNEMYPTEQWVFASQQPDATTTDIANATLKTRAVMWGTEAHENWYLLDYDNKSKTILVYYCAYTMDIRRLDSMAMVLRKKEANQNDPLTENMAQSIERKAVEILGTKFGTLRRIDQCH